VRFFLTTTAEPNYLASLSSCQAWNNSADYYRSILAVYQSYVERKNKQSLPALITGTEQSTSLVSAPHPTMQQQQNLPYSLNHTCTCKIICNSFHAIPIPAVCNYFDRTFQEYERRIAVSNVVMSKINGSLSEDKSQVTYSQVKYSKTAPYFPSSFLPSLLAQDQWQSE
jgi:hypothetical protein